MLEPIGKHIRLVDERNGRASNPPLLGVSIEKVFMPSVANTIGSNMANYKVVRRGQFACSLMQVRRDKKMPVALLRDHEEAIVSPAYPVFEIIDEDQLLPEYLMMWMLRPEFDREACFYAVGGVRGSLEWDDLCSMQLPVPSIEKQREIVKEYQTVVDRIRLNERLNEKLEDAAQAIYKQWFVEFEFPMTVEYAESIGKPELAGQPYKSSSGEMEYNEALEQEIPAIWTGCCVEDFCIEMKSGGTPHRGTTEYWNTKDVPWLKTGEVCNRAVVEADEYISQEGMENSSAKLLPVNTVLMAMYGDGKTKGQVGYLRFESTTNQACCAMICGDESRSAFLFYHLPFNRDENVSCAIGGAQENLSKALISALPLVCPDRHTMGAHPFVYFMKRSEGHIRETLLLERLGGLLLSRMAHQDAA